MITGKMNRTGFWNKQGLDYHSRNLAQAFFGKKSKGTVICSYGAGSSCGPSAGCTSCTASCSTASCGVECFGCAV